MVWCVIVCVANRAYATVMAQPMILHPPPHIPYSRNICITPRTAPRAPQMNWLQPDHVCTWIVAPTEPWSKILLWHRQWSICVIGLSGSQICVFDNSGSCWQFDMDLRKRLGSSWNSRDPNLGVRIRRGWCLELSLNCLECTWNFAKPCDNFKRCSAFQASWKQLRCISQTHSKHTWGV